MKQLTLIFAMFLIGCADVSSIVEPNSYRKCSDYSVRADGKVIFDLSSDETITDTVWVVTYEGREVRLTNAEAAKLKSDPDKVCREIM